MADKLREQIRELLSITCLTGDEPEIEDQIINLFKSQGYLSPEEAEEKYTDGKRDGYSFGRADAEQEFKSQVEGLTVIGDEEITKHELPDGDYDITGLLDAQLQDCQRQLGGME